VPHQKLVLRRQAWLAMIEKYLASRKVLEEFCQNEKINQETVHCWLNS